MARQAQPQTLVERAHKFLQRGDTERAFELFQEFLAAYEKENLPSEGWRELAAIAYHNVAYFLLQEKGQVTEALENVEKAIDLFPMTVFYNTRGLCFGKQGLFDQTEKNYLQAIKMDPKYLDPYLNYVLLLVNKEEYKKAIKWANRAMQIAAHEGRVYFCRGLVFYHLGRNTEALADLRDALVLGINQKDSAKAESLCRELDPEYYQLWDRVGKELEQLPERQAYDQVSAFLGKL